ncbi:WLM-domain-containing protein [Jaminaea rosea]|uniref:WLM-domain-containing protein n=1 Tax=Jaminaea rosea TaxID=1569628 RepID=A0A316UWT0_9BASI|nr:WLM-domain-containing protein [Jaminaea rosea]PWN29739.1 WLM-domain-containing protein [Jaminaea rosea]
MLRGTRPRSTGVGSTSSTNPFLSLAPHRSLSSSHPLHSRVIAYLTRLTQDEGVIHVCHLHNYTIGHLTELLPWENPELLGLNENKGQTIRLRIRTDDAEGFRDYKTTRQVLLHELAHIDVSGHPVEFKELNSKLNAELAAWEKNREQGTHSLVEGEMYAPAPQAGSSNSGGGSYVLGGGAAGDLTAGPASSDERRRAILDATLRRIAKVEEEIEAGCGSHQKTHQHQPSQA